mmetsp:Transcript_23031/g.48268  ORF Transcript_23031/g.48268 Transcript_23031/m.48268 type:complete len:482 (+) Transcript_23031:161-1606(+)|eukprot:CAMPEP_0168289326 /NCGR_PEP_ID=MMETSP0142_2-20121227/4225_1 /TAXON_ID=44445 /ORGANISM="Pseudo-nitzschia australis, Strain 10249 10 AB" /LENGTH=481 /DNA_ID=CAMNT_0008235837 /DNA_START=99 /DNA_END=1544 /DNA_ORIENTATION=+
MILYPRRCCINSVALFAAILLVCVLVDAEITSGNSSIVGDADTATPEGIAEIQVDTDDDNNDSSNANSGNTIIINNNNTTTNNNNNDTMPPMFSNNGSAAKSSLQVGFDLTNLLEAHDLSLPPLASMYLGTYWPTKPRDSDFGCPLGKPEEREIYCEGKPTYWKAEIVTPVPQGVNGSLVQAVLYTNTHRNIENPQRVLSFAGVMLWGSGVESNQTAIPEGACLAAFYQFKDTQAESAWKRLCLENGYVWPNMKEWATQIEALIEEIKPTFLTGHKMGCDIAKSVGILNPNLPVVCWVSTGTLNQAWIDAYPGLAKAIENSNHGIDVNNNMYVIQGRTDPHSMCLLPQTMPGSGVANICTYSLRGRCEPDNVPFDWDPWGDCSLTTSSTLGLTSGLKEIDLKEDCIAKEFIGIDFRLRDCPYEHFERYHDYGEGEAQAATTTSSSGSSNGGYSSTIHHQSISFFFLAVLELCFHYLLVAQS